MKKLLINLVATALIGLVAVPCTLIGVSTSYEIYERKISPWIKKKF